MATPAAAASAASQDSASAPSKSRLVGLTCHVHKNVYENNTVTIAFKTFGKDLFTLTASTREEIVILLDAMKDLAEAAKTCGDKEVWVDSY